MTCIACKIESFDMTAKLMGDRLVETLDPELDGTVNVWLVPKHISLDSIVRDQAKEAFREEYLRLQYKGEKKHTCEQIEN